MTSQRKDIVPLEFMKYKMKSLLLILKIAFTAKHVILKNHRRTLLGSFQKEGADQSMAICKKKIFTNIFIIILLIFFLINFSHADLSFKKIENKKVPFLDFFLLKFETTLIKRSQILRKHIFASRVQYSNINILVDYDKKKEQIFVNLYAVMDRDRYSKKRYEQKISDCNQVRNLIFYQKHGYKFLTQKRDPLLSQGVMEDIFKDVFFSNISFDKDEIDFLLSKMFVNVTIFHPIKKIELTCSGKVNDYELK